MKGILRVALVGCACLVAVGCQRDPIETGPHRELLQSQLATELPAYVKLSAMRIEASENVGDKVQPVFKARYRGTLSLTTDTFVQASVEDGVIILAPHLKSGTTRELYGIAVSTLL